jgi:hypothetical protein
LESSLDITSDKLAIDQKRAAAMAAKYPRTAWSGAAISRSTWHVSSPDGLKRRLLS